MTRARTEAACLADALRPEWGPRADALATAYDRDCDHHDRARFRAEVTAIKSCKLLGFVGVGQ